MNTDLKKQVNNHFSKTSLTPDEVPTWDLLYPSSRPRWFLSRYKYWHSLLAHLFLTPKDQILHQVSPLLMSSLSLHSHAETLHCILQCSVWTPACYRKLRICIWEAMQIHLHFMNINENIIKCKFSLFSEIVCSSQTT